MRLTVGISNKSKPLCALFLKVTFPLTKENKKEQLSPPGSLDPATVYLGQSSEPEKIIDKK